MTALRFTTGGRMSVLTEQYVKGSNNLVKLKLYEDGTLFPNDSFTELLIAIGSTQLVRVANGANGITLTAGELVINPAQVTEDVPVGFHKVWIRITDGLNPEGVLFGAGDTTTKLYFRVHTAPDTP